MPIWYQPEGGGGKSENAWLRYELDATGLSLGEGEHGALAVGAGARPPAATLYSLRVRGVASAVLIIGQSSIPVLVNGFPPLPISVLGDRSELIVGRHVLCFSSHEQPSVTAFSESDREVRCAVCTRPFAVGDEILLCGRCGAPQHEGNRAAPDEPPLLCASYDRLCCRCGEPQNEWSAGGNERLTPGGAPTPPLPQIREGDRDG